MSDRAARLSVAGNALVLLLLAGVCAALAAWHGDALWRAPAPGLRNGLAAAAAVAAWAGLVVLQAVLRRRRTRARTATAGHAAVAIHFASQTGFAEDLAWRSAAALGEAGTTARVAPLDAFDPAAASTPRTVLFVAATTGEGDAPDASARFLRRVMAAPADLGRLRYGLLALGDSGYADFCGFGRRLDAWLREHGAQPLFDRIEVDDADPGALRHWLHHLGQLAGGVHLADWEAPRYAPWRLAGRRLLNPGSAGGPAFHIALEPADPAGAPTWQAGDIAEIGPEHPPARVADWLAVHGLDAAAPVEEGGLRRRLDAVLAARVLPATPPADLTPQALVDALPRLPHREYSIASLPGDGRLELLVRQQQGADGALGVGSGWLTAHAPIGGSIALRVRRNAGFHPPPAASPLLLIGNGTGLAGLRAHLKARAAGGAAPAWLLFGERSAEHDLFFAEELRAWQDCGVLWRVDLAFSRAPAGRAYVQDVLAAAAEPLRAQVDAGAAILVCGSLQGMAPAVDAVLRDVLGDARVDALAAEGRYRRDVY
ncbi:sulfite reductase subunit alpha [Coralloluteibacterium stylophorae]|uniref:NADPH--hemoprotein reductase n=1 Tax=Coralloluteibacterium stylophorae TaxID=1776034 RepID=A0A8J8AX65_9GAMM|nr:sulfite reductase flavoprotein subunit alpha [Coralloluteibacterium stylophorae]MBS7457125.1 sulfite reductase flavoprotein subunit alpha [Coralloluteibacterium stylophorae]